MASTLRVLAGRVAPAVRGVSSLARTAAVPLARGLAPRAMVAAAAPARAYAGRAPAVTNESLAHFLKNEYQYEKENAEQAPQPPAGFTLVEKPDDMQVALVGQYNDEALRVVFHIDKQPDPDVDEVDKDEMAPYTNFVVMITKKTKGGEDAGTLTFELTADDELFIDSIVFCKDSKLATSDDIDSDWRRTSLYPGPNFNALPEELQIMWYAYLEKRGINQDLANFITSYMDYKENQEYLGWLKGVEGFMQN